MRPRSLLLMIFLLVANLCAAPLASACTPASDAAKSEAALRALTDLGADVKVSEANGQRKVMVITDGNWRGGDAGLVHLKDVAGLYKLRLAGDITDRGVAQLADICGLTSLDLHVIGLTDAGVREFGRLTTLQRLNLTYTKVSDAGLESLAGLKNLQWLGVSYTRVTQAGLDKLRQSMDKTIIEGNPQR